MEINLCTRCHSSRTNRIGRAGDGDAEEGVQTWGVNSQMDAFTMYIFRACYSRLHTESRSYMENINHTPGSTDGDLFCSEVSVTPTSCQRPFGSIRAVTTSSPLSQVDR